MNLTNKTNIKKLAVHYSELYRGGKFTRVSKSFLIDIEERVRSLIKDSVKNHPTRGKTIEQVR